jgi:hypothetical protein
LFFRSAFKPSAQGFLHPQIDLHRSVGFRAVIVSPPLLIPAFAVPACTVGGRWQPRCGSCGGTSRPYQPDFCGCHLPHEGLHRIPAEMGDGGLGIESLWTDRLPLHPVPVGAVGKQLVVQFGFADLQLLDLGTDVGEQIGGVTIAEHHLTLGFRQFWQCPSWIFFHLFFYLCMRDGLCPLSLVVKWAVKCA